MNNLPKKKRSFTYLILLGLLFFFNIPESQAQGNVFWSEQKKIPDYLESTEEPPFLIADMNHTVHAFNSQPLELVDSDSPSAVFYRQWTLESGWTAPNDILFDSNGSIRLISAASDSSGKVHLALQYNNNNVYYSQAFLSEAGNAAAWSNPILLGTDSLQPTRGLERVSWLATDVAGNNIVLIYSGSDNGDKGLIFVNSTDGGNSWSKPYPIYLVGDNDWVVYEPKLYAGVSGVLHAVWGIRKGDGLGGPGYYANFDFERGVWSEPIELDVSMGSPAVFEHDGKVFVSYIDSIVNANLWQLSNDGGKTWTNPERLAPQHIGSNGLVSYVVDGGNTLHAFFGQRINDENHGMWHTVWTGYGWTRADPVVKGPKVKDMVSGRGFDPQSARAVIVNGNVVLVTWATDGSSGTNGIWYSYRRLDAPELPHQSLPVPTPIAESVPTIIAQVATESMEAKTSTTDIPSDLFDKSYSNQNPQGSILIGVIPALILLVGVVFLYYSSHSRKK